MKPRRIASALQLCLLLFAGLPGIAAADTGESRTVTASDEWGVIRHTQDIEPGSALDFSFLLDAPAGKYGPAVCVGEEFEFEKAPGKKVRFYGVNLSFWTNELWSREASDRLADRLAAAGFNAVRLHANDLCLLVKGAPSYEIDPEAMKHFDYLFEALKKRGIYMTTDLLCRRRFTETEIPGFPRTPGPRGGEELKALIPVSDAAFESWKKFTGAFLTHRNAYSGIAWKDDPALLPFSLVNENTIPSLLRTIDAVPDIKAVYDEKFTAWLSAKQLSPASEAERRALRNRFLRETFETAFFRMRDYVRSLGVRQPLTEQNNGYETWLALSRSQYDYVDNHFYVDFPRYLGRHGNPPFWISDTSAIPAMNADLSNCCATRIFGKPFMITEFNWTYPSAHRAEAGAIAPAYAALQGWSGLFVYQHFHGSEKEFLSGESIKLWELAKDPVGLLSMRIGAMLFLRGDIRASAVSFPLLVDESSLLPREKQLAPRVLRYLGLVGKVGATVARNGTAALPDGAQFLITSDGSAAVPGVKTVPITHDDEDRYLALCLKNAGLEGSCDYWKRQATSSTGELNMDGKAGTFRAVSPRSEALTLTGPGTCRGLALEVGISQGPATFFVTSLDGGPLNTSGRLLLLHLTDSASSGLKTRVEDQKTIVEEMGSLPHLGKRSRAAVKLDTGRPDSAWLFYGLDLSGRRRECTELRADASGVLSLNLDGFATEEPRFAYELTAEKQPQTDDSKNRRKTR